MPRTRNATKTIPLDLDLIERQREVLDRRARGETLDEIAQAMGYHDRSGARKALQSALRHALGPRNLQEVRDLEVARLDRLTNAVWDKAMKGDPKAVGSVLNIMERRARLLGLDHAHGIAERAQALDEMQAAALFAAIGRALDAAGATPEQQTIIGEVLPRELAALSDEAGA